MGTEDLQLTFLKVVRHCAVLLNLLQELSAVPPESLQISEISTEWRVKRARLLLRP
jgi:hypothetical protein